jgi:hypothetical protein
MLHAALPNAMMLTAHAVGRTHTTPRHNTSVSTRGGSIV